MNGAQPTTAPAWEMAKVFWDGAAPGNRRRVWFSHRDPVEFGPDDYEDILWRLGETGFEPVAYQAWPMADVADSPDAGGPAPSGLREVSLFRRPLGAAPPDHHHQQGGEDG